MVGKGQIETLASGGLQMTGPRCSKMKPPSCMEDRLKQPISSALDWYLACLKLGLDFRSASSMSVKEIFTGTTMAAETMSFR